MVEGFCVEVMCHLIIFFFSQDTKVSSVPGSIEHTLEERINLYRMAVTNAKAAGETSKARRYERGLKVSRYSSNKQTLDTSFFYADLWQLTLSCFCLDTTDYAGISTERREDWRNRNSPSSCMWSIWWSQSAPCPCSFTWSARGVWQRCWDLPCLCRGRPCCHGSSFKH